MKGVLIHAPALTAPEFDECFKLVIDTSDIGVGGVLVHRDVEGIDHLLGFLLN